MPLRVRLATLAALALLLTGGPAGGPAPAEAAGRAGGAAAQGARTNGAAAAKTSRARARARASAAAKRRAVTPKNQRLRPGKATAPRKAGLARADRPGKVVGPMANPIAHLPRAKGERIVFGVMGGAGTDTPAKVDGMLAQLGGQIARGGHVVLTGASPGLPDHAVRGAKSEGGLTVGISSYRTLDKHVEAGNPTNFDVLQLTSLPPSLRGQDRPNFMGREIDNIERSDVIVIAGGRFGTLGELAIALEERRPVGVLTGSGGVAEIVKDVVRASTRAGKPPGAPVIYDSNPQRLVQRLVKAKREMDKKGVTGPLGDGFGNF